MTTNTDNVEKKTISGMEYLYIGTESHRVYGVPADGLVHQVRIDNPEWLYVRPSGAHQVITQEGRAYYIPKGFVSLYWENKDKAVPANF